MSEGSGQVWSLISSIAGAIVSLSFQAWKDMTPGEIFMALFVASSFGFFVSPLVLEWMDYSRFAGSVIFLMAAGSSVLIPRAIRWLSRVWPSGDKTEGGV